MIPDHPEEQYFQRISDITPDRQFRDYILTAMFAGVAAAAGYLLMSLPNIEAVTAILFSAGYTLGRKRGILAALVAALLYFGLNPQGGLFPPLLVAQIIGIAAAPVLGDILRRLNPQGGYRRLYLVFAAVTATIWFDLLTNLAFPLAAGFDPRGILITLSAGIPFSLIHITGNVVIFITLVPLFLNVLKKHPHTG